jgi:hypothetical protein
MKHIIGTITRTINDHSKTFTVIQCERCKRQLEVKGLPGSQRVEQALERNCGTCCPSQKPKGSRGWWTAFGLEKNPYVYGPMQRKRTSVQHRIIEARRMGWVEWVWDDEYTADRKK